MSDNAQGVVVDTTLNTPEYQDAREADGVGQHLCQWQGGQSFPWHQPDNDYLKDIFQFMYQPTQTIELY